MGSIAHIKDGKKELVKDIYRLSRLGVRLFYSNSGGASFNPSSESSLVVEVKKGHHPDLDRDEEALLVKMNESFALGGNDILRMTKFAHIIPVKSTNRAEDYAKLYIDKMACYHSSIGMEPFEVLYGRRCMSPVWWFEDGDSSILSLEIIHEALEKGVMRFCKKGKLSLRYVRPYEILQRVGDVAYELALPAELSSVHPVFHVSMLKKFLGNPTSILPIKGLGVDENLSYDEVPVEILGRQVKRLRKKEIATEKVLWRNHLINGATWEAEADMRSRYPCLFSSSR
ncbi:uncharacterized protein [Solanum lycopersicum]|uniref:uncharacterized protein n=1 Tax=Solanum lycopersicum TaxID=4081 RepID=UPI00374A318D